MNRIEYIFNIEILHLRVRYIHVLFFDLEYSTCKEQKLSEYNGRFHASPDILMRI